MLHVLQSDGQKVLAYSQWPHTHTATLRFKNMSQAHRSWHGFIQKDLKHSRWEQVRVLLDNGYRLLRMYSFGISEFLDCKQLRMLTNLKLGTTMHEAQIFQTSSFDYSSTRTSLQHLSLAFVSQDISDEQTMSLYFWFPK